MASAANFTPAQESLLRRLRRYSRRDIELRVMSALESHPARWTTYGAIAEVIGWAQGSKNLARIVGQDMVDMTGCWQRIRTADGRMVSSRRYVSAEQARLSEVRRDRMYVEEGGTLIDGRADKEERIDAIELLDMLVVHFDAVRGRADSTAVRARIAARRADRAGDGSPS